MIFMTKEGLFKINKEINHWNYVKFKAGNIKLSLFRTCCDEIMNIMVKGVFLRLIKENIDIWHKYSK